MFQRALVSVSDKQGLAEFLRPLVQQGLVVYSTGGTATYLREHGIEVTDVSDLTGFPEVLNGRVKTLHPHIYMSILADLENPEHKKVLSDYGLKPFDLVICNLYPFAATLKETQELKKLIEKIDIGGPTQVRAAAKNFQTITVLVDPKDYITIQNGKTNLEQRKFLAAKAFRHVAGYDALISQTLGDGQNLDEEVIVGKKHQILRYGENSHQEAQWYSLVNQEMGLHQAEVLNGKELSYNNLLDLDASVKSLHQVDQSKFAGVIVKHTNPCAVALDDEQSVLIEKLFSCDPVSMFGGICAFNFKVERAAAEKLSTIFLECIVAKDFSFEALEILKSKKNLRLLRWKDIAKNFETFEIRSVLGGFLKQSTDQIKGQWLSNVSQLSKKELEDARLAEACACVLKSNAIAIVKDGKSLGFGMGQTNRVDAVQQAIGRAQKFHGSLEGAVLASDAFFPFADSIEVIAQSGIKVVIQPGGSLKDPEVIAAAKKHDIRMVMTGERHFRH